MRRWVILQIGQFNFADSQFQSTLLENNKVNQLYMHQSYSETWSGREQLQSDTKVVGPTFTLVMVRESVRPTH